MIHTRSYREKRHRRSHSDSDEFSSDDARHHDRERKGPRLALDEALILVLHDFCVFIQSLRTSSRLPRKRIVARRRANRRRPNRTPMNQEQETTRKPANRARSRSSPVASSNSFHASHINHPIANFLIRHFEHNIYEMIIKQIADANYLITVNEENLDLSDQYLPQNPIFFYDIRKEKAYPGHHFLYITGIKDNEIYCTCESEQVQEIPCNHIFKYMAIKQIGYDINRCGYWITNEAKEELLISEIDIQKPGKTAW